MNLKFISVLSVLLISLPINAQWYERTNCLPVGWQAYAIDACDSLTAIGPILYSSNAPDSLYITSDGGNNWYAMALPDNLTYIDEPIAVSIIGRDKIWFCTGGTQTDGGKIYNTADGGVTWQLQFYDTSMTKFFNYIEMFDSLNGMAMGDAPANNRPALFLKTTNGGVDWISQNNNYLIGSISSDIWRLVDFADINTGYFEASGTVNALCKTTNGGKDWYVINDTLSSKVLKAYDESIILGNSGCDTLGFIYYSFDGGQTWQKKRWGILSWGHDIEFIPNNLSDVWLASENLCFSSDTGKTWVMEVEGGYFWDIVFTDENYGWLLGSGVIYRTSNGGHGGIVSVEEEINSVPKSYSLKQNFPNPFNPTTKIKYSIPQSSQVQIKVYDVLGNEIETLVNEEKSVGTYELTWNAANLPSGVYFYQLKVGSFVQTKKMVLLR